MATGFFFQSPRIHAPHASLVSRGTTFILLPLVRLLSRHGVLGAARFDTQHLRLSSIGRLQTCTIEHIAGEINPHLNRRVVSRPNCRWYGDVSGTSVCLAVHFGEDV